MSEHSCCDHNHSSHSKPWWQSPLVWVSCVFFFLLVVGPFFEMTQPLAHQLQMYVVKMWWALLLGLLIGGLVGHYVPDEYFSYVMARPNKRTIIHSVLLGFLMSVCSHGILALAMQFYKKGASTSSIIAFLLASPWANLPITLLLISFFGWQAALYIIVSALIIALVTGWIFQTLERLGWVETNPQTQDVGEDFSLKQDVVRRWKKSSWSWNKVMADARSVCRESVSLSKMILWWILLGTLLAAVTAAYVPEHFMREYMGADFMGMSVVLLVATVIEVCSEATAPLAFEIFRQTGMLGHALVFLMAGVATDYTEIGLIWQNVGKKAALWLPIVAVPQILFWGWLANVWVSR